MRAMSYQWKAAALRKLKFFLKGLASLKANFYKKGIISLRIKKKNAYDSEEFKQGIKAIGITSGDSIFVMCSVDKIYYKTGKRIPVHIMLNDIIEYLGPSGTLMVLSFSENREAILRHKIRFDIRKTPTESGIFSELLRRKQAAVRSLQPIWSATAYGKKAEGYCNSHHMSPYPYDENSPYYKIMQDGGKYLGIGVGFEAFTPCHMIDDTYKNTFRHRMYFEQPCTFEVVDETGSLKKMQFYVRNPATCPHEYDPRYYFKLLNIPTRHIQLSFGMQLFSFIISDFYSAAIDLYDKKRITIWATGRMLFQSYSFLKSFLRLLLK